MILIRLILMGTVCNLAYGASLANSRWTNNVNPEIMEPQLERFSLNINMVQPKPERTILYRFEEPSQVLGLVPDISEVEVRHVNSVERYSLYGLTPIAANKDKSSFVAESSENYNADTIIGDPVLRNSTAIELIPKEENIVSKDLENNSDKTDITETQFQLPYATSRLSRASSAAVKTGEGSNYRLLGVKSSYQDKSREKKNPKEISRRGFETLPRIYKPSWIGYGHVREKNLKEEKNPSALSATNLQVQSLLSMFPYQSPSPNVRGNADDLVQVETLSNISDDETYYTMEEIEPEPTSSRIKRDTENDFDRGENRPANTEPMSRTPHETMEKVKKYIQKIIQELSKFNEKFTLRLIRMTAKEDLEEMPELMKDFEISQERPVFFIAGGLKIRQGPSSTTTTAATTTSTTETTTEFSSTTTETGTTTDVPISTTETGLFEEPEAEQETSSTMPNPDTEFTTLPQTSTSTIPVDADEAISTTNYVTSNQGIKNELIQKTDVEHRTPVAKPNRRKRSTLQYEDLTLLPDELPIPGRMARTENPFEEDELRDYLEESIARYGTGHGEASGNMRANPIPIHQSLAYLGLLHADGVKTDNSFRVEPDGKVSPSTQDTEGITNSEAVDSDSNQINRTFPAPETLELTSPLESSPVLDHFNTGTSALETEANALVEKVSHISDLSLNTDSVANLIKVDNKNAEQAPAPVSLSTNTMSMVDIPLDDNLVGSEPNENVNTETSEDEQTPPISTASVGSASASINMMTADMSTPFALVKDSHVSKETVPQSESDKDPDADHSPDVTNDIPAVINIGTSENLSGGSPPKFDETPVDTKLAISAGPESMVAQEHSPVDSESTKTHVDESDSVSKESDESSEESPQGSSGGSNSSPDDDIDSGESEETNNNEGEDMHTPHEIETGNESEEHAEVATSFLGESQGLNQEGQELVDDALNNDPNVNIPIQNLPIAETPVENNVQPFVVKSPLVGDDIPAAEFAENGNSLALESQPVDNTLISKLPVVDNSPGIKMPVDNAPLAELDIQHFTDNETGNSPIADITFDASQNGEIPAGNAPNIDVDMNNTPDAELQASNTEVQGYDILNAGNPVVNSKDVETPVDTVPYSEVPLNAQNSETFHNSEDKIVPVDSIPNAEVPFNNAPNAGNFDNSEDIKIHVDSIPDTELPFENAQSSGTFENSEDKKVPVDSVPDIEVPFDNVPNAGVSLEIPGGNSPEIEAPVYSTPNAGITVANTQNVELPMDNTEVIETPQYHVQTAETDINNAEGVKNPVNIVLNVPNVETQVDDSQDETPYDSSQDAVVPVGISHDAEVPLNNSEGAELPEDNPQNPKLPTYNAPDIKTPFYSTPDIQTQDDVLAEDSIQIANNAPEIPLDNNPLSPDTPVVAAKLPVGDIDSDLKIPIDNDPDTAMPVDNTAHPEIPVGIAQEPEIQLGQAPNAEDELPVANSNYAEIPLDNSQDAATLVDNIPVPETIILDNQPGVNNGPAADTHLLQNAPAVEMPVVDNAAVEGTLLEDNTNPISATPVEQTMDNTLGMEDRPVADKISATNARPIGNDLGTVYPDPGSSVTVSKPEVDISNTIPMFGANIPIMEPIPPVSVLDNIDPATNDKPPSLNIAVTGESGQQLSGTVDEISDIIKGPAAEGSSAFSSFDGIEPQSIPISDVNGPSSSTIPSGNPAITVSNLPYEPSIIAGKISHNSNTQTVSQGKPAPFEVPNFNVELPTTPAKFPLVNPLPLPALQLQFESNGESFPVFNPPPHPYSQYEIIDYIKESMDNPTSTDPNAPTIIVGPTPIVPVIPEDRIQHHVEDFLSNLESSGQDKQ